MAKKARKKRELYTPEQRAKILAAATKEGLAASAVQKKFGVTPVTYYSWRRKSGVGKRRGRAATFRGPSDGLLKAQLRSELQARMRRLLPELVRAEVSAYLDTALRSGRSGRRRRG